MTCRLEQAEPEQCSSRRRLYPSGKAARGCHPVRRYPAGDPCRRLGWRNGPRSPRPGADQARGVPRGATGELLALEQQHVGDAALGEVVGDRAAADATADDDNLDLIGKSGHIRIPSVRVYEGDMR